MHACTFDFTNIRFICASTTNPYQLSYIPVTSPYTRVYDTMSSTNHDYVRSMQYHVLSDNSQVIYMATNNKMVRYNSQVPTSTPAARTPTHTYGSTPYYYNRLTKDYSYVVGVGIAQLTRCSLLISSCTDIYSISGYVYNILNRLTGNHMVVLAKDDLLIRVYNIDPSTASSTYHYAVAEVVANLMTISQTDNDIVYIGLPNIPRGIIQVRFNNINNGLVNDLKITSQTRGLHVMPSTTVMIAAENSKIYLIDLDNFAAGAIASTIVNIASGAYFDRSISIDMHVAGNDAYFDRARL